jgi:PAS domain S-box-containing protein
MAYDVPMNDRIQTTVRLPRDLHLLLKETAARTGMKAEALIQKALARELSYQDSDLIKDSAGHELFQSVRKALEAYRARTSAALEPDQIAWSPLTAYLFLASLPTLAVVKDHETRIVWCNTAYERTFGMVLSQMRGKTITELGFVGEGKERELVEKGMKKVLRDGHPLESREVVRVQGREPLFLQVHRFVFAHPTNGLRYLGDISFDSIRMAIGQKGKAIVVPPPPTQPDILPLCIPFLEQCPASIALKDREARFVWGNSVLFDLADVSTLEEIKGKTAEEVFRLPPSDPIVLHDEAVAQMKTWMCVEEVLPKWPPRTTIRFPILDSDERVQLVGGVATQFQLAYEYDSADWLPPQRTKPGSRGRNQAVK